MTCGKADEKHESKTDVEEQDDVIVLDLEKFGFSLKIGEETFAEYERIQAQRFEAAKKLRDFYFD